MLEYSAELLKSAYFVSGEIYENVILGRVRVQPFIRSCIKLIVVSSLERSSDGRAFSLVGSNNYKGICNEKSER